MKKLFKIFGIAAGCLASGMALQSCALDDPFNAQEGEGRVKMKLVINSDVTRV